MIIIIDGYNVLKRVLPHGGHITEREQMRFIRECGIYAKYKGHTIIIAFDAGPYGTQVADKMHGITVVYSGNKRSADDVIIEYLKRYATHDVLLVSSDTALVQAAVSRNGHAIDAYDFYVMMQQVTASNQKSPPKTVNRAIKTSSDADSSIDALMEEYSTSVPQKQEQAAPQKTREKTLSKVERQALKKIKKL